MSTRQTAADPAPSRILVIVDTHSRVQPGLEKAARLARVFRARLEVYACDYREGLDGPGRARREARRDLEARGREFLVSLARESLPGVRRVEFTYELGHPRAERVLAHVRRSRADLVVVDSHFHADARRALFTAADWPLIRDCPVPLLYAKPARWHSAPRIAAAVDPRHPAEPLAGLDAALVRAARRFARALKGSLHVVHAWLPLEPAVAGPAVLGFPPGPPAEVERLLVGAEREATEAVTALVRGGGRPEAEVVLLRGAAVETLPGFAEVEGLDVLVLGTVSRSRLYEALVGATAERLLERVPCDLLVVKRPSRRRGGGRRRIPV